MSSLSKFTGSEIFLDANIWIYAFTAHPQWGGACHQLLKKVEAGQIEAFTSPLVINETIHKLMLFEIRDRFRISLPNAMSHLKSHSNVIPALMQFQRALDQIHLLPNLTILEIGNSVFEQSCNFITKYRLLSSDATHAATCLTYNVRHLATNDKDFKRVKGLTIWTP